MKKEETSTKIPVYGLDGKVVDHLQLDGKVFDGKVNKVLLYEVNRMYLANKRQGTVSAKTRAEVSGGGSKPWKQKGTGRARVGSTRNPVWRHGGVTFAPKPRDFYYSMPKKAVKGALVSSLNARILEKTVKAIVKIEMPQPKTKQFKAILDNLKMNGKILVIVDKISPEVMRSSRNIKNLDLMEGRNINARDVLLKDNLLIEKVAFEKLAERLK